MGVLAPLHAYRASKKDIHFHIIPREMALKQFDDGNTAYTNIYSS